MTNKKFDDYEEL